MLKGVDVSDWQPGIGWQEVNTAGYSFAIIKATQGTGNVQATFSENRETAPAFDIQPLGLYHFAQNGDPVEQADHFCDVVGTRRPNEFLVLDIESHPIYFTLNVSQWPAFIEAWGNQVRERLGEPIIVYMSESPAKQMPKSIATWYPLWVAGYVTNEPTDWEDWQVGYWPTPIIWQWSSSADVPGIGACDANIAPDDLMAKLGLVSSPTVPTMPPFPPDIPQTKESEMFMCDYGGGVWLSAVGLFLPLNEGQPDGLLKSGVPSIGPVNDGQAELLKLRAGRVVG